MFDIRLINDFLDQFDESKRQKMLEVYITSLESHIELSKQAYAEKKPEQLHAAAHDLKSLSYTLSANVAGDLAKAIEKSLVNNDNEQAYDKVGDLVSHIEELITVMKAHPLQT